MLAFSILLRTCNLSIKHINTYDNAQQFNYVRSYNNFARINSLGGKEGQGERMASLSAEQRIEIWHFGNQCSTLSKMWVFSYSDQDGFSRGNARVRSSHNLYYSEQETCCLARTAMCNKTPQWRITAPRACKFFLLAHPFASSRDCRC